MEVFVTGYRFDLLILSFALLPIVLLQLLVNTRHKLISQITRGYLLLLWIFISALYFLNSLLFSTLKDRIWLQDWGKIGQHLNAAFQIESTLYQICLLIFSVLIFFYGLQNLMSLNQYVLNLKKRCFSFCILVILVFLARGSLGKDHLRRNDCDFKSSSWVRAFCLNPIYTFSKLKNNEF